MGQSANILPDHHPIRLADDIAAADHMIKVRLDPGIARGTNSPASIQFHPAAGRRDPATDYRLFTEVLKIMKKCRTQDAMTHESEFHTFPVPGWSEADKRIYKDDPEHFHDNGALKALDVMPRSYQKPYPPIWQSADGTMSYACAAERGHALFTGDDGV